MEWLTTRKKGFERRRIKFAWLPIECDDGLTRWLQRVEVVERFWEIDGFEFCGWETLSAKEAK